MMEKLQNTNRFPQFYKAFVNWEILLIPVISQFHLKWRKYCQFPTPSRPLKIWVPLPTNSNV